MTEDLNPVVVEELMDPEEVVKSRAQWAQFDRNWAWFEEHAREVYAQHRGKIVCVAGQELFVADTTKEVVTLAAAAHPEDEGWFTMIVPQELGNRIHVHPVAAGFLVRDDRVLREEGRR